MVVQDGAILPNGIGVGGRAASASAATRGRRDMSGDMRGIGDATEKLGRGLSSVLPPRNYAVIRGGRQDDAAHSEETPGDTAELTSAQPAPSETPAEQPASDSRTAAAEFGRRGTVV